MSLLCWVGLHSWEWRFTRFDPVSSRDHGSRHRVVRLYRCKRCNKGRERT